MPNLITTAGTALAGVALAALTAFGLPSVVAGDVEQSDEPVVVYGER